MKKKISIILAALVIFSGCSKSALDYTPQDQLASTTFWKSAKDVELALNGCYAYLSNAFNYSYDDASADNAYAQYPWESNATRIASGDIKADMDAGYAGRYQFIRRYNYFLENIDKAVMDADLKSRFIAECRVLRAFTYFELARTFGPVPLLKAYYNTDPLSTAEAPAPEMDVVNFAIAEIKEVADKLPARYTGGVASQTGRITSGAAYAILTRIQLHYKLWADAAASAQKVMGAGYKLFRKTTLDAPDMTDDYSAFVTFASDAEKQRFYKGLASYQQQFWIANEANDEVILASQNISENASYAPFGNGLRLLFTNGEMGGWSSVTPTQDLVNAYWERNGNAFIPPSPATRAALFNKGGTPAAGYFNEFKNRDTRLYASILFPGETWSQYKAGFTFNWEGGGSSNSMTGYNFRKCYDIRSLESSYEYDAAEDFPIIRYAEILLSYAEAKNELSGPDASVYAALDDIRDRSGMPAVNQAAYNSKDKLRTLIQNERRIELAGEGQRFYDIRRWNIAAAVMKTTYDISNAPVQDRVWQDRFRLMPYPQTALDRNANLKAAQQAKGY
ncbi:RagB/SusD family nutrient uptake outer membrane protein [Niabella drilacis]|uniref:Starch-binding associating with outer membrane n=1 Tax=Niabella drilacis (strain DSM 25811 / CCM 8410 / CCUG 62505 / LMG 26954 / E90) TaxID=1285928 RepID=A0A1G7A7Z4_NIADE|nr:RagB/SusD family nutrient uptake outer membrane protein [Niabella drilacis]SDE10175.1 Starch-binding associating with outer membrane [Niabella drilacis]